LAEQLLRRLPRPGPGRRALLKLPLPEQATFSPGCMHQPPCLRVAALSGGYSREESCRRLAQNRGMIASFSRALTEGLSAAQSDAEFTATLAASIDAIAAASAS
ncbi:MAG: class I fructose-bisphosphate aldolase, partial [Gammaproteobacteria bacterium]|nr:class I fructose-bisphosphate aldolase [Gammaproteobacteria bacterium]